MSQRSPQTRREGQGRAAPTSWAMTGILQLETQALGLHPRASPSRPRPLLWEASQAGRAVQPYGGFGAPRGQAGSRGQLWAGPCPPPGWPGLSWKQGQKSHPPCTRSRWSPGDTLPLPAAETVKPGGLGPKFRGDEASGPSPSRARQSLMPGRLLIS